MLTDTELPTLAALPADQPRRSLFTPAEQRYAGYLAILAPMANDIAADGSWMGGWWRLPLRVARKQEHVYTLSWFYANQRPWNPYAGDPALLARCDRALEHYLALQHPDGSWPERSPTDHGRAATGFGLGYLAKTLAILREVGALPERQRQLAMALHAAMSWFLNPNAQRCEPSDPWPVWDKHVRGANQAAARFAGATIALQLDPDPDLEAQLRERIEYLADRSQSPSGYLYEELGWDHHYNFGVALPELAEVYLNTGNSVIVDMARRFTDWFGYTMLREPDGSGWLTYAAISARTDTTAVDDTVPDPYTALLGSHFISEVPDLAAFFTSAEDMAAARAAWAAEPDPAPGLIKPDTSPRMLAHAPYGEALPDAPAKAAAIGRLPYLRQEDFAELRRDPAHDQDYVFVRRPSFFLGAHFGTRDTDEVRTGPGFLWHPRAGTIVQSQRTNDSCWATLRPNGSADADGNLHASYTVGMREWDEPRLTPGDVSIRIRYHTTTHVPSRESVATELVIDSDSVVRSVISATGPAVEQIPLILLPDDELEFADGTPAGYGQDATITTTGLTLYRNGTVIEIDWAVPAPVTLSATATTFLRDRRRRLHVLRVQHPGQLSTRIRCR